ncbi:MAG: hypothetical protein ACTSPQ_01060 [Candidatus Helarchaeota archaeon]
MSRRTDLSNIELLEYIYNNQPVAASQVAQVYNLKYNTLSNRIKRLLNKNIEIKVEIKREGRTQRRYYSITEDELEKAKEVLKTKKQKKQEEKHSIDFDFDFDTDYDTKDGYEFNFDNDTSSENKEIKIKTNELEQILVQTAKIYSKIPEFDDILRFCEQNNNNRSCELILKYCNYKKAKGGGWKYPIKHVLNVLKSMVEEK